MNFVKTIVASPNFYLIHGVLFACTLFSGTFKCNVELVFISTLSLERGLKLGNFVSQTIFNTVVNRYACSIF